MFKIKEPLHLLQYFEGLSRYLKLYKVAKRLLVQLQLPKDFPQNHGNVKEAALYFLHKRNRIL